MYTIKAKATEYHGIVFRSQFEAICYDYLITQYPDRDFFYEPPIIDFFGNEITSWTPDLGVIDYSKEELDLYIYEFKPKNIRFDYERYIDAIINTAFILACMNEDEIVHIGPGVFRVEEIEEIRWKQAYNNVKFHGKHVKKP